MKPVKLLLQRVRLNGDYDSDGRYWGASGTLPLYRYSATGIDNFRLDMGLTDWRYIRASNRNEAKAKIRKEYPRLNLAFFN